MTHITNINENIFRIEIPYKDIYTTVYIVKTEAGVLFFDAASSDEDIETFVLPYLAGIGITTDSVKYVFISHNHRDHARGIAAYCKAFPGVCIITRSSELKESLEGEHVLMPDDGDSILSVLNVIAIPGHTKDSAAIFDRRTKTLITGDCLQLRGIFGSGLWAANIRFPDEHFKALDKVKTMDIDEVLMAHDYHPCGYHCEGAEAITTALNACTEPLKEVEELILSHPNCDDEAIAAIYNRDDRPTLGAHVVTAMRNLKG